MLIFCDIYLNDFQNSGDDMIKDEMVSDKTKWDEKSTSASRPFYQKPKTSLFLETTTINGGNIVNVLESNGGDAYLTS